MKSLTNILAIAIIAYSITSCSSSTFINRKYTSGLFLHKHKNMKHNTVVIDTTAQYASLINNIELKQPKLINTEKEITEQKVKSIIKKDSVFLFQRKGNDRRFIKKCEGKHVLIILDSDLNIKKTRPLKDGYKTFNDVNIKDLKTAKTNMEKTESIIKIRTIILWALLSVFVIALAISIYLGLINLGGTIM